MDRQNKDLQKKLHNRDVLNQSRQLVLSIYDAYLSAYYTVRQGEGHVSQIFSSDQGYYQWINAIDIAGKALVDAYNRANLLIDNPQLKTCLKEATEAYFKIGNVVHQYVNSGVPMQTIQLAWNEMSKHGIIFGNYMALAQNQALNEQFLKHCETSYTKEIEDTIKIFTSIVQNEEFDEMFRKYIQIQEI